MKITDEAVEAFEEKFYGRHERGFIMKPLIDMGDGSRDARTALEAALPHLSQGAVRVKPLEWVDLGDGKAFRAFLPVIGGIRIEPYGACGWWEVLWSMPGQCDKLIPDVFDTVDEAKAAAQADYERRIFSALSRAPVGVTGEVTYEIENEEGEFCAGADSLADAQHYATIYEQDHPVRLVEVTRRVISSPFALASHEPEPAPTDTQERMSVTGEVVGWSYEYHDFGEIWPRGVILNRPDGGANPPTAHHGSPVRNVTPLARQSALTACQQEVEALREGIKEIAERERGIRDNWVRHEAETGARILELETDLEIATDKVERLRDLLDRTIPDTMEYDAESGGFYDTELTHDIRAALGGQSNE